MNETGERITYSPGYLVTVAVMAAINAILFWVMAGKLAAELHGALSAKGILSVFFGILFAAGCNLTALPLARWTNRQTLWDRILIFVLIEMVGLTLFALIAPGIANTLSKT